jgi:hypothetical protein
MCSRSAKPSRAPSTADLVGSDDAAFITAQTVYVEGGLMHAVWDYDAVMRTGFGHPQTDCRRLLSLSKPGG